MQTPKHIGFIMDGNGRWAEAKGLPRIDGYAEGLAALKRVIKRAENLGVLAVSVFAFSTENWSRPDAEIEAILNTVELFNKNYEGHLCIRYMGNIDMLPDSLADSVAEVERRTQRNEGMILNIALNYGGQDDVLSAAKVCFTHGDFSKEKFEKALGSAGLPPLDVIVRTGGEKRLSGFMLYESAYAELIFIDKLWPDMNEADVDEITQEFNARTRKFGA